MEMQKVLAQFTALREAQGITKREVGKRMGMREAGVWRLEHPKGSVQLDTLERMAKAINAELVVRFEVDTQILLDKFAATLEAAKEAQHAEAGRTFNLR